jgi:hypothetical protein
MAEKAPDRVSRLAPQMRDLRPAFVQWMLHGIEQAVGARRPFAWAPLLELLESITSQPRAREGGRDDDYADLDPGWVWTRRAIAGLLERGVSADESTRVPWDERLRVWRILEPLTRDYEPTIEDELRDDGTNFDPVTLSLNTTRPRATRAAIAYAVWVYQQTRGTDEPTGGGFFGNDAPEVARVLAEQLDPASEPSIAVRAVLGEFFANLVALDSQWAEENANGIFQDDDTPQREAAWGAYVIYTRPYDNVFLLLRSVYERSAELAGGTGHGFRWMNASPVSRLGEHLAAMYWRGVIELDDPLLPAYWERAPAAAREDVVATVGRWARDIEITPDLVARLRRFWTFISENVRSVEEFTELAGFSWWFMARGLPAEWRLDEMQRLVESGIRSDAGGMVAEELPELVLAQPLKTVRLLHSLIRGDEAWFPDAWQEEIERVLRIGYRSGDEATQRLSYDTVNLLLEKGFRHFAVVLEQPTSDIARS